MTTTGLPALLDPLLSGPRAQWFTRAAYGMDLPAHLCLHTQNTHKTTDYCVFTPSVDTHMHLSCTHLSFTSVPHHLSNLELNKVHEDGFSEVFKSICCCQVWDQTPLLKQHTIYQRNLCKHLHPHSKKRYINTKQNDKCCDVALDNLCNFEVIRCSGGLDSLFVSLTLYIYFQIHSDL